MKKSDIWHIKEGIARDMNRIWDRIDIYFRNREKRDERFMLKVYELEGEMKRLKKIIKVAKK